MKTHIILAILTFSIVYTNTLKTELRKTENKFKHKYENTHKFDENYSLQWKLSEDKKKINFAIDCETSGWVGLGFSVQGRMAPGTDMIIAFIDKNGKPSLTDRFATTRTEPQLDTSIGGTDDLTLISMVEDNGHLLVEFSRKLNTGDRYDREILLKGDVPTVWAYSKVKPETDKSTLGFHEKFGSVSIAYVEKVPEEPLPDLDVETTTFHMENYPLTGEHTEYVCKEFKFSEMGVKEAHIVRIEPVIDNSKVMHHIEMFECNFEVDPKRPIYNCIDGMPNCQMIYVWAVGMAKFDLPKTAGIRIAGRNSDNIIFRYHYDNRPLAANEIDSSGLRFHHTPHFRIHDAGVIPLSVRMRDISIPPRTPEHIENSTLVIPSALNGIKIYSHMLHMHLIGIRIRSDFYRDDKFVQHVGRNDDFHFDQQEMISFPEIPLKTGDRFYTECVYNSTDRSEVTVGGFPSTDEMCINFVSYYPKVNWIQFEGDSTWFYYVIGGSVLFIIIGMSTLAIVLFAIIRKRSNANSFETI